MKNKLIALVLFVSTYLLLGNPAPLISNPIINSTEIYLAFALIFTFAVGLEVVK
ncbi:MAG: hypothetical protein GOU98_01140 [Candidatus Altiarchaeota archaeon]|nr:hypothetical protein [Candidatus Altiarchaeota archaeon]